MSSRNTLRNYVGGLTVGLVFATAVFAAQPRFPSDKKSPAKKPAGKAPSGKTGAKKPAGRPVSKADAKLLAEWNTLDARRQKLRSRLKDLNDEFRVSSRVRKLEIKKEFERLLDEWKKELEPKMVKLSLVKLKTDPDSDLASSLAEDVPDQRKVVDVTEQLIKAGKNTGPVLRLAGLAHFNVNDFQRAADLLEQARDKNARIGVFAIDQARDYVKYWEKEQQLRKQEAAAADPKKQLPQVLIETSKGNIVVELFENEAPNTVANFISLVEKKFYDGEHFYDSKPRQSISAGDPRTKPKFDKDYPYGLRGIGYSIKNESTGKDARMHFRGSLSMLPDLKDSDGSLFAILRTPQSEWNPTAGGLGGRTVFGRVVKGMDVVDKLDNGDTIVKMTVLRKRPHPYKPRTSEDKDEPAGKDTSKSKAPAFPKEKPKSKGTAAKKKTPGKSKK